MARAIRNARLNTRSARTRLEARREPFWTVISEGCALGYRRGAKGGYWIAKEALRHIWRNEDECPGVWEKSAMARAVFKELGSSDWLATRQFVYATGSESNRGDIGKLALAVAQSATEDVAAMQILSQAGAELARLANAMLSRYGARPVALAGRAATLHPVIESTFRCALPANISVTRSNGAAHIAAARIAAKMHLNAT